MRLPILPDWTVKSRERPGHHRAVLESRSRRRLRVARLGPNGSRRRVRRNGWHWVGSFFPGALTRTPIHQPVRPRVIVWWTRLKAVVPSGGFRKGAARRDCSGLHAEA